MYYKIGLKCVKTSQRYLTGHMELQILAIHIIPDLALQVPDLENTDTFFYLSGSKKMYIAGRDTYTCTI